MGKYFKLFETHAEYEAYIAQRDKTLPNISYCLDYEESHFNPLPAETRVVATFNVATTSAPTKILNNTSSFTKVEVDDIEKASVETGHTFDTTGEHEVKYTLSDPTSIGAGAFTSCSALENVKIPKGVETIDENAFMACTSLDSVVIPNSVTSIGSNAFSQCQDLTSVIIPEKMASIGSSAFNGCSSLTSIKSMAENAPVITNSTFEGVGQEGTLLVPNESTGYDVWMQNAEYYLGKYDWSDNIPWVTDEGL